jgi:MoxR-like ATPase
MFRLHVGYPDKSNERQILLDRETANPLDFVRPVMSETDILELQLLVADVKFDESLIEYLLQIVELTRSSDALELGISPRGTLALFRAAQALALIEGRDFCTPDDIKRLVLPCFTHRVIVGTHSSSIKNRNREAEQILRDILNKVKVPL